MQEKLLEIHDLYKEYGRNEGKIIIALPDTVTGVLVENISSKTAVFTVK